MRTSNLLPLPCLFIFGLLGCSAEVEDHQSGLVLSAACALDDVDGSAWLCPQSRSFECDRDNPYEVQVFVDEAICADDPTLMITPSHLDTVGAHEVIISTEQGPICSLVTEVVDTTPPEVEVAHQSMWPPNHKMHTFVPEDCVTVRDRCDYAPEARFTWASSDEVFDAKGAGNHSPDIVLAADGLSVDLRAERSGREDGRVYRLGVVVTDASGNETRATCNVTVAHDQSGRGAVDSGEAVRLEL